MKFGTRKSPPSLPSAQANGASIGAGRSPATARSPGRFIVPGLLAVMIGLVFLIRYRYPVFPYLVLALVITSLWRLRAGTLCLAGALTVLALTEWQDPALPWREGARHLLVLALWGLICLGARAVLDGIERQRRTELRLIADLSAAVEQLQESERKQALALQSLAEHNYLLQAILDAVDNGIFLVGAENRIGFANERLGELLDLDWRDVIGRDAGAAVLGPLAERCRRGAAPQPIHGANDRHQVSRQLIELLHPSPRLLYQYRAPVRDDDGRELGSLYVYSDLPDRERLQELLEQRVAGRTRELQEAQEQLLRSARLAALGQFSATVAHELRNPLNVVKLSAHYVAAHVPNPDEKLQRNLAHLNRYVDRACAIISDLLTFSRLPPPELRPVAINDVLHDAIAALPVAEGVTVEWALASDLPPVMADASQIEQAVGNLGLNALQAMPEGGRLALTTRQRDSWAEIRVADSGPGIPEELHAQVFEPFFTTKASGTGLGLPLVREIAAAHGGHLSLDSAPGEGACFTLALPLTALG